MVDIDRTKAAPFNMALARLEALNTILIKIREIYSNPNLEPCVKQEVKVELVRQFCMESFSLLDEQTAAIYEDTVLDLEPVRLEVYEKNYGGGKSKTNKTKLIFDKDLESKLNMLLIDMQRELAKKNYFMPPKKDISKSLAEF